MPQFICSHCDFKIDVKERPHQCEKCENWNTYDLNLEHAGIHFQSEPIPLNEVVEEEYPRIKTNISPLDWVTGGGFVKGGIYALSGEPGIGKSTLLAQIADAFKNRVLYVSAEESVNQIKLRKNRLGINTKNIIIWNESSYERIAEYVTKNRIKNLIIDSIQVMQTETCKSAAGSSNQVRECGNCFVRLAKTKNVTTILVVHVTKDGDIAGPKTLEHMVDAPLFIEQDSENEKVRILKASKNRFGPTAGIRGLFEMGPQGLIPYGMLEHDKIKLVEKSLISAV
jgi:DNA repair protein RadA/Sms